MKYKFSYISTSLVKVHCIHRIASGGYYGFRFVTPPPQCVERFYRYRSNKKNIIASLLKFAGYIFIAIKSCLGIFLASF